MHLQNALPSRMWVLARDHVCVCVRACMRACVFVCATVRLCHILISTSSEVQYQQFFYKLRIGRVHDPSPASIIRPISTSRFNVATMQRSSGCSGHVLVILLQPVIPPSIARLSWWLDRRPIETTASFLVVVTPSGHHSR